MNHISAFKNEYLFLSNKSYCNIYITIGAEQLVFSSAESLFYYGKAYFSKDKEKMKQIYNCSNVNSIINIANEININEHLWESYKFSWMCKVVQFKFEQNLKYRQLLIKTFPSILINGNYWHDLYWGIDLNTNIGQNNLGLILMLLRNQLLNVGESIMSNINDIGIS